MDTANVPVAGFPTTIPPQWMSQFKTMIEDAVEEKIQPVFTTLQSSIDDLAVQMTLFKKFTKTQKVFNEGIQLKRDDYFKRVMQNTVIRKVLYIMKYVISTPHGVFVTWPVKLKDDRYVFVTNVNLLKFVTRHLFPKDLPPSEIDNVVSELIQCQIETYTFEEKEIEAVRTLFPVEPCKKNKTDDKKYKWFGLRAEVLKELFTALQDRGDIMVSSKFAPLLKEWTRQGRDTGRSDAVFKPWALTPGSRSQVYPTKSTAMIHGKIQWGVEMPAEFFTEDVYKATQIIGTQSNRLGNGQHIGCGWSVLYQQPLVSPQYLSFHAAVKKIPKKPSSSSRKRIKSTTHQNEEPSQHVLPPPSLACSFSPSPLLLDHAFQIEPINLEDRN